MPDPTSFLEALKISPIGAEIQREVDNARFEERKQLAAELAELNAAADRDWPVHEAACDKSLLAVKKAEENLRALRAKHAQNVAARTASSATYHQRRGEIEAQLAKTASPLLHDFTERMRDELRKARKALTTRLRHESNFVTGAKREITTSNGDRVRARLEAISGAIEAAQDAALLADQSQIPDFLFRLEAELPPVEEI